MTGHATLSIESFGSTVGYTRKWSVFLSCIKMMLVFNILMLLKGELQHNDSKSAYANSNKGPNKDFQIVRRAFQRHMMDGIRRAERLHASSDLAEA